MPRGSLDKKSIGWRPRCLEISNESCGISISGMTQWQTGILFLSRPRGLGLSSWGGPLYWLLPTCSRGFRGPFFQSPWNPRCTSLWVLIEIVVEIRTMYVICCVSGCVIEGYFRRLFPVARKGQSDPNYGQGAPNFHPNCHPNCSCHSVRSALLDCNMCACKQAGYIY